VRKYDQMCAFPCWKRILRLEVRTWVPEEHARRQVLNFSGKNTFSGGQDFGSYYIFNKNFSGYNKILREQKILRGALTPTFPVAMGLLRRHEKSMKHVHTTVTFSRRCKSLGRIDTELACQVNQSEKYWKSLLQRLPSVIKFFCWLRIGV